jgi:DNA-binding transcriptional LysR family regulator
MLSSWDDLKYLEALHRLGSASAAGRELGVAPSTVYRRIVALETSVGFACVARGSGVTAAGRELVELARHTVTSLSEIAKRTRSRREEVAGTVILTTLDGFAPLLAAPLAELAHAHPRLRVDVHISDTGLSLRKRQADIALSLAAEPRPDLIAAKLFSIRFGVYGTRTLAAAPSAARWVVLGSPLERSWLAAWEQDNVPSEKIAAATASRRLLVELVQAGAGLGLLPAPLADGHPDLVELTQFREGTSSLTRNACLLYPADLKREARIATVVRVIIKHLRTGS